MQNKINLTMQKNKKGISSVVSTFLIISLSIVLIGFLGLLITNSIKQPFLSPTVSCNEFISSSKIEIENVCYNKTSKEIKIKIKSSVNSKEFESLTFELSNAGKTEKWISGDICGSCETIQAGETKIYYLTPNEKVQLNQASLSIRANECLVGNVNIDKTCN